MKHTVIASSIATAVLVMAGAAACGSSGGSYGSQPNPRPIPTQMTVQQWLDAGGRTDLKEFKDDVQAMDRDVREGNIMQLHLDCGLFSSDLTTLKIEGSPPVGNTSAAWQTGLGQFQDAATACRNGDLVTFAHDLINGAQQWTAVAHQSPSELRTILIGSSGTSGTPA